MSKPILNPEVIDLIDDTAAIRDAADADGNIGAAATKKRKSEDGSTKKEKKKKLNLRSFKQTLQDAHEINAKNLNTPYNIYSFQYLPNWGIQEALRELLTNTIDQARAVAARFNLPGELTITDVNHGLKIHIGDDLLAEVSWKRGPHRFEKEFAHGGVIKSKLVVADVDRKAETVCIDLVNYSSFLPWRSFCPGVSSKRNSKVMIGTHGEGLSAACTVLNRHGCNVTATCSTYSAKIIKCDTFA